jgi:hypothetical protein
MLFHIEDTISKIEGFDEDLDITNMKNKVISELIELARKELKNDELREGIQRFIKDAIQDWGWLIPRLLWFIIYQQIKTMHKWMVELSTRCHLDSEIINEALIQLINAEVFRPVAFISWCNNHPENPQYHLGLAIAFPTVSYCGLCGRDMKQLNLVSLHPTLLKYLKHHDGLPLIASSWLAQQQSLQWGANLTFDNREIDLWVADRKGSNALIFEFWMTNVSGDPRAFSKRLKTKLRQLELTSNKLGGKINDIPIKEKYVVVNTSEEHLSKLLRYKRENYTSKVISIDEIYPLLMTFNV